MGTRLSVVGVAEDNLMFFGELGLESHDCLVKDIRNDYDLDARLMRGMTGLAVYVRDEAALGPLNEILARETEGSGHVALFVTTDGNRSVEIELPQTYALSPALGGEIGALSGVSAVRDLSEARSR